MNKITQYKEARDVIPAKHLAWPLYGAGLDKLGYAGKPVVTDVPSYKDNELLARIDAVSLCYSDVKQINLGNNHPRLLGKDLQNNPVVPGHEVSLTIVGVGKELADQYKIGDRYTLQPDVWFNGKSVPFCHELDGGYRKFAMIGKEILHGDAGNYLIKVPDEMPYAAAAITEPWACVEAAYRMQYRNHILSKGHLWLVGSEKSRHNYQLGSLFDQNLPAEIVLTNPPQAITQEIIALSASRNITVSTMDLNEVIDSDQMFDDIIVLDCDQIIINQVSKRMNKGAVFAILAEKPVGNTMEVDIGRLHYDDVYYTGTTNSNLSDAYQVTDPRAELKPKGITWIMGAGGPMGRMHLQRAIEAKNGPVLILASEVTKDRFESLKNFFLPLAERHKKELIVVNPVEESQKYSEVMEQIVKNGGVDDIEVMVGVVQVIEESIQYLAERGVINLFAGLKRGVCVEIDPWLIYGPKQIRFVGHSGSGLDDQKAVVEKAAHGELKPELSVAAVGGLNQVAEGIRAMEDRLFAGKIIIYPHVLDYPLISLHEFKEKDPGIYKLLGAGETWTKEAEDMFLEKVLT